MNHSKLLSIADCGLRIARRALALSMVFAVFVALAVFAQTQPAEAGTPNWDLNWLTPLLAPVVESLAGKYGWMVQVLVVIGALRVCFKPVMFFLETRAKGTADEERLAAFERGPVYKMISFILDFGASVKINQIPTMKKTGTIGLIGLIAVALGSGCVTGPDGKRTADLVKLSQAKALIDPLAASGIRRALNNSPEHAPQIAKYASSFAGVFCTMNLSNEFRPEFLEAALTKFADPELAKVGDGYLIDIKNTTVGLYKVLWGDRFRAEIPETNWLHSVCEFFCEAINHGLTDGGYPGGVKKTSASMRQRIAELLNSSTAQCSSGGRFQSRPFPARTAKMKESASQLNASEPRQTALSAWGASGIAPLWELSRR